MYGNAGTRQLNKPTNSFKEHEKSCQMMMIDWLGEMLLAASYSTYY